jgi:hypothetical protein
MSELDPTPTPSNWISRMAQLLGRGTHAVNSATAQLKRLLPVDANPGHWFTVSEAEVAEILERVRSELPTTEAVLMGKPQAGKSSIVRGLTGVSAEIIGQGFRPHTQHTQRYAYPSNELPLIVFTDTVGLGDVSQETGGIIDELVKDLGQKSRGARVLILTTGATTTSRNSLFAGHYLSA